MEPSRRVSARFSFRKLSVVKSAETSLLDGKMEDKKEPIIQQIQHKDLETKIEELEKTAKDYLAGWQRARADFLNYKKEEAERKKEFAKYVKEDLILQILPILDNIYIAEKKIPAELKDNQWMEGFSKIKNQFENFLKEQGIEEIKSINEKFDPIMHEAVEQVESDKESGIIVDIVRKGYMRDDRVIRAARVKVSK